MSISSHNRVRGVTVSVAALGTEDKCSIPDLVISMILQIASVLGAQVCLESVTPNALVSNTTGSICKLPRRRHDITEILLKAA